MNSEFTVAEHPFGKRTRNSGDALWCALLGLIAVLPYTNTLWNGFVYDDVHQVLGNPYIRSFRFIKQILTTSVWSFRYSSQGRRTTTAL